MKLRISFLVTCTAVAVWVAGCIPVSAATRHVVLLFDERVELPGLTVLEAELVRTLRFNSLEPIEVYREGMDLSQFGSESYKTLMRDFLREKYANRKIDVAVAVMAPAFEFLLAYGGLIFPGTPIVICGLDRRQRGNHALPPNMHGVLVKREFGPTLDLVTRLHPKTESVVVVSGTAEFDTRLLADAKNEFRAYENRLSFTYLSELPLEQLLHKLSQLPARNVVVVTTFFRDGDTFLPR